MREFESSALRQRVDEASLEGEYETSELDGPSSPGKQAPSRIIVLEEGFAVKIPAENPMNMMNVP